MYIPFGVDAINSSPTSIVLKLSHTKVLRIFIGRLSTTSMICFD
jgi:hypothetical protein